jgi:hypothetical protein
MNTRKYTRTTNEAFPKTAEYAASLERPARYALRTWPRILSAACLVLIAMYAVACTFPTKS